MKFLKDDEYLALKTKADNYGIVVSAAVSVKSDLEPETATPEQVVEALSSAQENEDNATELQTQLEAANQRAETAESRVTELETENKTLKGIPAETTATVKTDADTIEKESIAQFADKNVGNTAAILKQAKEYGLI